MARRILARAVTAVFRARNSPSARLVTMVNRKSKRKFSLRRSRVQLCNWLTIGAARINMKTTVIPLHFVLSETNPAKIPPEKQVKQQLWELFFLLSWEGMDEQTSLRGLHTFNWSSLKSLLILAFENTPAFSDTTHFDSDMVDTHQKVKNSLTFHWPFINEKQSMFTFALAFFAGHRYFSLNFQEEEGIWKENIQNQNHWPQPLYVRRTVSNWSLCLPYSILFIFPKENAFESLEENLWTIGRKTEFPDFTLTLTISKIFPDFFKNSLTFPWPWKIFVFPWLFLDRGNPVWGDVGTSLTIHHSPIQDHNDSPRRTIIFHLGTVHTNTFKTASFLHQLTVRAEETS